MFPQHRCGSSVQRLHAPMRSQSQPCRLGRRLRITSLCHFLSGRALASLRTCKATAWPYIAKHYCSERQRKERLASLKAAVEVRRFQFNTGSLYACQCKQELLIDRACTPRQSDATRCPHNTECVSTATRRADCLHCAPGPSQATLGETYRHRD